MHVNIDIEISKDKSFSHLPLYLSAFHHYDYLLIRSGALMS